jgi:hypothetical protein
MPETATQLLLNRAFSKGFRLMLLGKSSWSFVLFIVNRNISKNAMKKNRSEIRDSVQIFIRVPYFFLPAETRFFGNNNLDAVTRPSAVALSGKGR